MRGGAHEGTLGKSVGCCVGWTYLIFRKLAWPLLGWKASDRDVGQDMMMRNGEVVEVMLDKYGQDWVKYYLGFRMLTWRMGEEELLLEV